MDRLLSYINVNRINKHGNTPLLAACKDKNAKDVRTLLSRKNIDVNTPDNKGDTPLVIACRQSNDAIVRLLLRHMNTDVNTAGHDRKAPLVIACQKEDVNIAMMLMRHLDTDVNLVGPDGNTPLISACKCKSETIVKALTRHMDTDVNKVGGQAKTALLVACEGGHTNIVRELLYCRYIDVNLGDPLLIACKLLWVDIIKMFLAHRDIDVNKGHPLLALLHKSTATPLSAVVETALALISRNDTKVDAVLIAACETRSVKIVQALLDRSDIDASETDNQGETPLFKVCRRGDVEVLRVLLGWNPAARPFDVNKMNKIGETPLTISCKNGNACVVKELLKYSHTDVNLNCPLAAGCRYDDIATLLLVHANIDVNAVTPDKRTALHAACHDVIIKTVRLLFEQDDIDVNKTDINEKTPLITACGAYSNVVSELHDIIKMLLMHADTNVNAAMRDGCTALHVACQSRDEKIAHLLLKHKRIDVDKADNDGNTPLMMACKKGRLSIVRKLIDPGEADINKTNNSGYTSFEIACSSYYADTACILLDAAHIRKDQLGKDVYDACCSKDSLREYLNRKKTAVVHRASTDQRTYYTTDSYVCSSPYSSYSTGGGCYDTGSSCSVCTIS